jgi:hypothetical protein
MRTRFALLQELVFLNAKADIQPAVAGPRLPAGLTRSVQSEVIKGRKSPTAEMECWHSSGNSVGEFNKPGISKRFFAF